MEKKVTPLKAIRAKCLDCCCGQSYEVKNCTAEDCPLYLFRFGKNPNIKYEMTEARAAALKTAYERMAAVRDSGKENSV